VVNKPKRQRHASTSFVVDGTLPGFCRLLQRERLMRLLGSALASAFSIHTVVSLLLCLEVVAVEDAVALAVAGVVDSGRTTPRLWA
jgi:hypothetical protein